MHPHPEPARLAAEPADYSRFHLLEGRIDPREDGLRLDTGAPNIEWWYFDSLLDDGAKLAVIFCTKDASRPHQPLEPLIEIDLDLPDGRRLMKYGRFKADQFSASKDGCDVHIGQYRFVGNLHEYTITGAAEDVSAEVRLEATTEPWRPGTGHLVFGPEGETVFAWTPFVPMGKVTATYRIGSEVHEATGTGYHDHNWMNQEMAHLVDHWYWGRGQVGPYAFVGAYITTARKYGYTTIPLYMLARDGRVIADDGAKLTFSRTGSEVDEHTGKVVPDALRFEYRDGDSRDVLTYTRERTLVSQKLVDLATGYQRIVAEIVRYPGGYLRFAGPVTLERYRGGELIERYEEAGSFEQSYFARELHGEQ
jgi:hypothetical protein